MPTFMKIVCAVMVAVTQGAAVLVPNEALDAHLAQLEAKVKALEFGAKLKASEYSANQVKEKVRRMSFCAAGVLMTTFPDPVAQLRC